MPENSTTTKFKVDISELVSGMQQAKRQISLANAEFKAATAGLDNWSKSADGVSAKLTQLDKVLNNQKSILKGLESQYEIVAREMGEDSKEAENLKIKIENQKAAVAKTEKDIRNYNSALEEIESSSKDAEKGVDNLDKANGELKGSLKDVERSSKKAGDGFTIMKGALASLVADGVRFAISEFKSLANTVLDTAEKADDLNTKAKITGVDTQTLQEWEYASQFIDTSVDSMTGAMKKLTKNMSSDSKSVNEAFEKLGVNAKDANGQLRNSNDVFLEIIDALGKVTNETERDAIAMTLFGKSATDLNPLIESGTKELKKLSREAHEVGVVMDQETVDSFNGLNDAMDRLKAAKTNVLNEIAKELLETGAMDKAINFFEKKALPVLKNGASWIIKNFDKITSVVAGVGSAFLTWKVASIISGVVSALNTFRMANEGATIAQWALNAAMDANPAGLLALAIGSLVGTIALWTVGTDSAREKAAALTEEEQKNKEAVDALYESYKSSEEMRKEAMSNIESEFAHYQQLRDELDSLVDENGKVKEGYEERANFIISTLNDALGSELEMTDGIISNYQEEKKALDDLIKTKKAQIVLQAAEQDYTKAINNQTEAFNKMSDTQRDLENATRDLNKEKEYHNSLLNESDKWIAKWTEELGDSTLAMTKLNQETMDSEERMKGFRDKQMDATAEVVKAQEAWSGYNATIKNYEGLSSAIISGDTNAIINATQNMVNSFVTAESGTRRSLANQVENMKQNYSNLKKAVEDGAPGVTQEMVAEAQQMVEKSISELNKFDEKAKVSGINGINAYSNGFRQGEGTATGSARQVGDATIEELGKTDFFSAGNNAVEGFSNGMRSNNSWIDVVRKLGVGAKDELKNVLGIHSPSKITYEIGGFFTKGFVNSIYDMLPQVKSAVRKMGDMAISGIDGISVNEAFGVGDIQNISPITGRTGAAGNVVNNNYTFNQVNNSPKTLDRLEIYRQTKNQFNYATGGVI